MNQLKELLARKRENLLSIYCTAGYPELDSLPEIIQALEGNGVDMIEVGIPYSDPLADGPTIQQSNSVALENGMSLDLIFTQLHKCETNLPIILMGYFNPVLQYGVERFCQRCKEVGVSGVIIPDLPLDLYQYSYASCFAKNDLSFIFLVTPQTSQNRLWRIDRLSTSFIYAVSSNSITGGEEGLDGTNEYLERLQARGLAHPVMVGFNVRTARDLALVNQLSAGGIIGSAFIQHLEGRRDLAQAVSEFVASIRPDSREIIEKQDETLV